MMEKLEHGILSKHNVRIKDGELVKHGHETNMKHIAPVHKEEVHKIPKKRLLNPKSLRE